MGNAARITVIGSSNTDMVVATSHFPAPGETILGGEFLMNAGGKGANQAVAAARLGGNVSFVGKVGDDVFGRTTIEHLTNEGIDVSYVTSDPDTPSGVAQIIVDQHGENCIVVAPGANLRLSRSDVDRSMAKIEQAAILLMQLEVPLDTILYAARKAHHLGLRVILNPAPAAELPTELFESLHTITPNQTEAELLTGVRVADEQSAAKAAALLNEKGVANIVITLGASGAYLFAERVHQIVPGYQVKAVDTTAAGDCFNGALAVALARGAGLLEAVKFANRAASIAVTRSGAQASLPFIHEIEAA